MIVNGQYQFDDCNRVAELRQRVGHKRTVPLVKMYLNPLAKRLPIAVILSYFHEQRAFPESHFKPMIWPRA